MNLIHKLFVSIIVFVGMIFCSFAQDSELSIIRWDNGRLRIMANLSNGLKHGEYLEYDKKGRLWLRCNFVNDTLDGYFEEYYRSGNLKKRGVFVKGKYQGKIEAFIDSKDTLLLAEGEYENGYPHGVYKLYTYNRKNVLSGHYEELFNYSVNVSNRYCYSDKGELISEYVFDYETGRFTTLLIYENDSTSTEPVLDFFSLPLFGLYLGAPEGCFDMVPK